MKTLLVGFFIGIILSFGAVWVFNSVNSAEDQDMMEHDHASHSHDTPYYIPPEAPQPSIELLLHSDSVSGWNLELVTSNFRFTPHDVGKVNVPGAGHAHIYVNGEKLSRVYTNWYHISELPAGSNEVKVTLNTNDHLQYYSNFEPVEATITITSE